jgi:hypothetical protein
MTRRELMNGLLGLAASGGTLLDLDAAGRIGQCDRHRRIRYVSEATPAELADGGHAIVSASRIDCS